MATGKSLRLHFDAYDYDSFDMQLSGANVMTYYLTYVFIMANLTGNINLISAGIQYALFIVFSLVTFVFIDSERCRDYAQDDVLTALQGLGDVRFSSMVPSGWRYATLRLVSPFSLTCPLSHLLTIYNAA